MFIWQLPGYKGLEPKKEAEAKKDPEPIVKIGSKLKLRNKVWLVAQVQPGRAALIDIDTGGRWSGSVRVKDGERLSPEEVAEIVGEEDITKAELVI